MFSGFYNLASGMITYGKHLDVISNNMANVATTGFKVDTFTGQTFDEVMYSLVGNKDKNFTDIGERSYATVPSELYTDYTQGSFDETIDCAGKVMMPGLLRHTDRRRHKVYKGRRLLPGRGGLSEPSRPRQGAGRERRGDSSGDG